MSLDLSDSIESMTTADMALDKSLARAMDMALAAAAPGVFDEFLSEPSPDSVADLLKVKTARNAFAEFLAEALTVAIFDELFLSEALAKAAAKAVAKAEAETEALKSVVEKDATKMLIIKHASAWRDQALSQYEATGDYDSDESDDYLF